MGRKRVALTLDENIYAKFQEIVVDYGYPRAAVSMLIQKFMADTIRDVEKTGISIFFEVASLKNEKSSDS